MGLGLNLAGMASGYKGFKDEQRRLAEDDRKAAADAQAVKDQAYLEEQRDRQRYEWRDSDRRRDEFRKNMRDGPPAAAGAAVPAVAVAPDAVPATPAAPAAELAMPGAPAGSSAIQTSPVPDPAADISPLRQPASAQVPPVDAALAGGPQNRRVPMGAAPMPPAAAPPIDSELAGAPPDMRVAAEPAAAPVAAPAAAAPAATAPAPMASAPAAAPVDAAPAAPASPLAQPAGIPQPRKMTNILNNYLYALNSAAQKGDIDAEAYVKTREFLNKAKSEGVIQAMDAFAAGRFEDGIRLYNSMGEQADAKLISAVAGTTILPDGRKMPTNLVTIQNADGTRATIDTTLDRFKIMGLEKQADYMAKSAQAKHYDDTGKAALKNADTTEQYRKDVNRIRDEDNKEKAKLKREEFAKDLQIARMKGTKLDDKEIDAEVERNPQLYNYTPEGGEKDVTVAAAKSLYNNSLLRFGNANKVYATMAAMKAEAMRDATDPKTKVLNQAQFMQLWNAKIAEADAKMRKIPVPGSQPVKQPDVGDKGRQGVTLTPDAKKRIENGELNNLPPDSKAQAQVASPTPDVVIPSPPPQMTQRGLTMMPNPAYADWAKKYKSAYEAQQEQARIKREARQKDADAYTLGGAAYAQQKQAR